MPSVNTINTQTKNSLPTFVHTKYANLVKGLEDKKVQPPIFGFLSDLECMVYVDHNGNIYKILVDRISQIEKQLEGLKDESGQPIKVTDYVTETIAPIEQNVIQITGDITDIKQNGATIIITSDGGDE